jgi:hypothetical protein
MGPVSRIVCMKTQVFKYLNFLERLLSNIQILNLMTICCFASEFLRSERQIKGRKYPYSAVLVIYCNGDSVCLCLFTDIA